jgi:signal peptidase II
MWPFLITAALVLAADLLSKLWITSNLAEGEALWRAGIFAIVRIPRNSGAIFGLFQDQSLILTIVAFIGIGLLLLYMLVIRHQFSLLDSLPARLALGLVLGGTIGNLIDRLRFGGVTDFISIGWWPVFNVADMALTTGIILFAFLILFLYRAEPE